jgi:hypothetical protein
MGKNMEFLKKTAILAFLIITLPLYGEIGDHAVLYGEYKYVSVDKMAIETAVKYMDGFLEEYCSTLETSMIPRNGSFIKNFIRHYYFQKGYRLEHFMSVKIEIHYEKPLFSFQREYNIDIEFEFKYFPPYEKDITEWPNYGLIAGNLMDQFDDYVSKNGIILSKQSPPMM